MNRLLKFLSRLRALFVQKRDGAELGEEIAAHLDLLRDRFIGQGMSHSEAAAAARRQFGNATLLHQRHREARTFTFFSNLWRDVTYGVRILLKSPGFTLIAALTLASLAVGANTTIFFLTKQLLFERLAVPHAENLRLSWVGPAQKNTLPFITCGGIGILNPGGVRRATFFPIRRIYNCGLKIVCSRICSHSSA